MVSDKSSTSIEKTKIKNVDELNPEDRKLKEDLEENLFTVINKKEDNVTNEDHLAAQTKAINHIISEIRASTSTMTAIPKPLKFLRQHYLDLEDYYLTLAESPLKLSIADVLSVLSMTMVNEESNERTVLAYRLKGNQEDDVTLWGGEYLRFLCGEISREYSARRDKVDQLTEQQTEAKMDDQDSTDVDMSDLTKLIDDIVAFLFSHGGEIEACDLLFDINQLSKCVKYVTVNNTVRIGRYLYTCAQYIADRDDQLALFTVCFEIFLSHSFFVFAVVCALKMPEDISEELITRVLTAASELPETVDYDALALVDAERHPAEAFILTLHRDLALSQISYVIASLQACRPYMADLVDDKHYEIMGNGSLSKHFRQLCVDLDVLDPKSPDDVMKKHLQEGHASRAFRASSTGGPMIDSALQNIAQSFINAFTNVGSGKDSLLSDSTDWLYRNRDVGMVCAAASVGLIHLWDVEEGFSVADKYTFVNENYIKAGSYLASGILATGVTSDLNAALPILAEQLEPETTTDPMCRITSALGLGIGFANTHNEDVLETLLPLLADETTDFELICFITLALGFVFVSSGNDEILGCVLEAIIDRQDNGDLDKPCAKLLCVGVGLLYLSVNSLPSGALESFGAIEHPIQNYLSSVVRTFAYAGTGNIVAVQHTMSVLTDNIFHEYDDDADDRVNKPSKNKSKTTELKDDEKNDKAGNPYGLLRHIHQGSSLIGLAALAHGESLTQQMLSRNIDHLLQCSTLNTRRAIPLALSLNHIADPDITVVDSLIKLAHDQDQYVSMNGCLALGFVGCGTNNSRIAELLRNLANYYTNEPHHLYCIRVAQGILHLGKGVATISPLQCDGLISNKTALASVLVILHACLDLPNILIKKYPFLLFILAAAIKPRFVMTVDAEDEPVPVAIRIGQAVDTIGMPGTQRNITGPQTHNTPVLLQHNQRAELLTDDYFPMTTILEGVVCVTKNINALSKEL